MKYFAIVPFFIVTLLGCSTSPRQLDEVVVVDTGDSSMALKPKEEKTYTPTERDTTGSEGAYGRIFPQGDGVYFVEVNEEWLYIIPGKVDRLLNQSEQKSLKKELSDLDEAISENLKRNILSMRGGIPGETARETNIKSIIFIRKMLEILNIPRDVQEYLYESRGVPIDRDREPDETVTVDETLSMGVTA